MDCRKFVCEKLEEMLKHEVPSLASEQLTYILYQIKSIPERSSNVPIISSEYWITNSLTSRVDDKPLFVDGYMKIHMWDCQDATINKDLSISAQIFVNSNFLSEGVERPNI